MNFQNVRLRPLLCAVLSVILVTGSMILPAFAAEQNVNFSYVESVPSANVAPALWKIAGCSETLPASSAQMVLNDRIGANVDGYISSDKKTFILNHDYLDLFLYLTALQFIKLCRNDNWLIPLRQNPVIHHFIIG